MVKPYLIIAVGNESRGDDALGPLLLRRIADWLAGFWLAGLKIATEIELLEEFQLQVENTLDLMGRELVLIIDAGKDTLAPFTFCEATKKLMAGHTSHAVAPEILLSIYVTVHGEEPPPTFILCVEGTTFELGEPLSPQASKNLEESFNFALGLLKHPEKNSWRDHAHSLAETTSPKALVASYE